MARARLGLRNRAMARDRDRAIEQCLMNYKWVWSISPPPNPIHTVVMSIQQIHIAACAVLYVPCIGIHSDSSGFGASASVNEPFPVPRLQIHHFDLLLLVVSPIQLLI